MFNKKSLFIAFALFISTASLVNAYIPPSFKDPSTDQPSTTAPVLDK